MEDEKLIKAFEIHAKGKISIHHHPADPKLFSTELTLEDLFRMFKLRMEKESNAVHMD